nr:hypothetical protein CFP56_77186 [Quercus suber]
MKRNEGSDWRGKRADGEDRRPMIQKSRSLAAVPDKEKPAVQLLGECFVENTTSFSEVGASKKEENHGNGLVSTIRAPKRKLIYFGERLRETKAKQYRIKGLQRKLNLTQGITVPCDGRSGGLAMM